MNTKILSAAVAFLGTVMGAALPAQAVSISKTMFIDPSTACQLSIPTTDTGVRPRATGYRNEGTSGAFVICGTAYLTDSTSLPTELRVQLVAFDGATHTNVSCTAVTRSSDGASNDAFFSSRVVDVSPAGTAITWLPGDLNNFNGFARSVTCALPPGVAISGTRLVFPDNVGA